MGEIAGATGVAVSAAEGAADVDDANWCLSWSNSLAISAGAILRHFMLRENNTGATPASDDFTNTCTRNGTLSL
jgi:hypothetical protein